MKLNIDMNLDWQKFFLFMLALLIAILGDLLLYFLNGSGWSTIVCMTYIFYQGWTKEDK